MAFSAQMLDIMTENMLNNDKGWYKENRERFRELVDTPMAEFAERLNSYIVKLDSSIDKVHISRIYRDARYLHGRSYFRDNMWVSFGRVKDLYKSLPAFYFDISPNGAEYGCGFYVPPTGAMEKLREMIDAHSPLYERARECMERSGFALYGDKYKKKRFPDASPEDSDWLERKSIGAVEYSTDWERIFSEDYADYVGERLTGVKELYELVMTAALGSLSEVI